MTVKLIKQMIDACRLGKRACDMMPPLPKDVLPSYIHVLSTRWKRRAGLCACPTSATRWACHGPA